MGDEARWCLANFRHDLATALREGGAKVYGIALQPKLFLQEICRFAMYCRWRAVLVLACNYTRVHRYEHRKSRSPVTVRSIA